MNIEYFILLAESIKRTRKEDEEYDKKHHIGKQGRAYPSSRFFKTTREQQGAATGSLDDGQYQLNMPERR